MAVTVVTITETMTMVTMALVAMDAVAMDAAAIRIFNPKWLIVMLYAFASSISEG